MGIWIYIFIYIHTHTHTDYVSRALRKLECAPIYNCLYVYTVCSANLYSARVSRRLS